MLAEQLVNFSIDPNLWYDLFVVICYITTNVAEMLHRKEAAVTSYDTPSCSKMFIVCFMHTFFQKVLKRINNELKYEALLFLQN